MSTVTISSKNISRKWHIVDAKGQILGRLASTIAQSLSGKGKKEFSPHVDCGDFVVVINADGIEIKGNNKGTQKIDFRHSGFPGGHTMTPYKQFLKTKPERAIELAVSGMLAKNKLRPRQLRRLKVYKGENHPHGAQFAPAKSPSTATEETKQEG